MQSIRKKAVVMILIISIMTIGSGYVYYSYAVNKEYQEALLFITPKDYIALFPRLKPKLNLTAKDSNLHIQNKFKNLMAEYNNNDIVGYLKISDSTVDYPVVQGGDNDFYLSRGLDKKRSSAGSIFLDFENDYKKLDRNSVIYGHNMNKNYMFHSLRYFNDKNYYENHKYITFDTLYGNQTWEIFAFYKTNISFNYIKVDFKDDEDFLKTVQTMKEKSIYDTGVSVGADDKILTLSTCSNEESDTRFVLNAKLVNQTFYSSIG